MHPILYSFRRCPYAMRARLSLAYSGISYIHREILLKNRPDELYTISPKGTVPVMELSDETVMDESLDIMKWALSQNDPEEIYKENIHEQDAMIVGNDGEFKKRLDQYKYHIRFPDGSYRSYQDKVALTLRHYDRILSSSRYLFGQRMALADMALFPFVRQCAHVDFEWFNHQFSHLSLWLEEFKTSEIFGSIMKKYDVWESGTDGVMVEWS
jgi:glutathione S-transferase|tara:strand:+ start:1261 stop:1896 length:636 start_codon:yes stop_codon:yes gene_type:complete